MPPDWIAWLARWVTPAIFLAIISIPTGIALRLFVSRREFYRRNIAGIQEFSSYSHSVAAGLFEGLIYLLANLLVVAGLLSIAFAGYVMWFQHL